MFCLKTRYCQKEPIFIQRNLPGPNAWFGAILNLGNYFGQLQVVPYDQLFLAIQEIDALWVRLFSEA